ncbi:MAG: T9SS type A sorting domain-containing protein [Ignavibacteriaceae bacterium]|nr:T9SS type A sorting domain-containing protein [Ignavibacteriaceae bacterium]
MPWTDINGNPRDSSPDLGAYEYTETHGDLGSNSSYTLSQNYPNPFNPTTAIEYYTAKSSQVKLVVYDMIGQIVQTLVNGEKASGSYEVVFNGNNLTSGVYFYRLEIANFAETKR